MSSSTVKPSRNFAREGVRLPLLLRLRMEFGGQIDNFPLCIDRLVFEKAWGQEIADQLIRKKSSPH